MRSSNLRRGLYPLDRFKNPRDEGHQEGRGVGHEVRTRMGAAPCVEAAGGGVPGMLPLVREAILRTGSAAPEDPTRGETVGAPMAPRSMQAGAGVDQNDLHELAAPGEVGAAHMADDVAAVLQGLPE